MNKLQSFEQFLTTQSVQVSILGSVINLVLAAVLGYLLSLLYIRFGTALSNRRHFARNFVQLTMTTMLIITIVKSSLALSLGLVGALSIVRFRAAIKEPEELSYLFLAIAMGLGCGADQWLLTVVAFVIISAAIILRGLSHRAEAHENLHLTVSSHKPGKIELSQIVDALKQHCQSLKIKRFDESDDMLEVSFLVELAGLEGLEAGKNALRGLGDSVQISFMDNKGLI